MVLAAGALSRGGCGPCSLDFDEWWQQLASFVRSRTFCGRCRLLNFSCDRSRKFDKCLLILVANSLGVPAILAFLRIMARSLLGQFVVSGLKLAM